MPAPHSAAGVFLQQQAGLLEGFSLQKVAQPRVGGGGQLFGQLIQLCKERAQIRFGVRRRHGFRRLFQLKERLQKPRFDVGHPSKIRQAMKPGNQIAGSFEQKPTKQALAAAVHS
jgi:hypothetical protein